MALTENRRAFFDYDILETFEAGIELKGFEVKSIVNGRVNISSAYGIIKNNEAWLLNMEVTPYQPKNTPKDYDPKRTRKLLLKKKEIKYLIGKIQERGLTLIPLKVYLKNSKIKLEIGLAKRRKKIDKRELIKKREAQREIKNLKWG